MTTYRYSSRGELLSVDLPDGRVIEYLNDPLGRRIAKLIDGVIVEKYLWQGLTRLLAVYDGSDNLLMRFEYADDRMPPAMTVEGVTYYLSYDQVGSLRVVADASGNVVKRIEYDAFGNVIGDSNAGFTVPFAFAGGLYDSDTGLVRFGYRDYDPDIGRWTAKDPIGFAGGDTDLYRYVLNDPVNWVDFSGLMAKIFPWLIKKAEKQARKRIGGAIADKIGDKGEIDYPIEQQEMDKDTDGDGQSDFFDEDDDNDGMPDIYDDSPLTPYQPIDMDTPFQTDWWRESRDQCD